MALWIAIQTVALGSLALGALVSKRSSDVDYEPYCRQEPTPENNPRGPQAGRLAKSVEDRFRTLETDCDRDVKQYIRMRKAAKTDEDKRKVDAQAPDRYSYAKRFYALAN